MSTNLEDRLTELDLRMPDTLVPRILAQAAQTGERDVASARRRELSLRPSGRAAWPGDR